MLVSSKRICFASHNRNKVEELRSLIGNSIELVNLDDLGIIEDIPETGTTLEENARLKAEYVYSRHKIPCFADDTGLEVESLDGRPGVYSARYAGEPSNSDNNIAKLLREMSNIEERSAQFRTVIAYIDKEGQRLFEGVVKGEITKQKSGRKGFGYDPVFIPNGFDCTFAEMTMEVKNSISHRGQAVRRLVDFLSNLK